MKKEADIKQCVDGLRDLYGRERYEDQQGIPSRSTPQKCSAPTDELCTSTSYDAHAIVKRRRYDTPTRRTFQTMVPSGTSPAVAVSVLFCMHGVCIIVRINNTC